MQDCLTALTKRRKRSEPDQRAPRQPCPVIGEPQVVAGRADQKQNPADDRGTADRAGRVKAGFPGTAPPVGLLKSRPVGTVGSGTGKDAVRKSPVFDAYSDAFTAAAPRKPLRPEVGALRRGRRNWGNHAHGAKP